MRRFLWIRVISRSHLRDSDPMRSFPGLIAGASGTLRVVSSCQTLGRSCSLARVHYHLCCCFAESLLRYRSSQIKASCVRMPLSLHFQCPALTCLLSVWGSLHRNHLTLVGCDRRKWRLLFDKTCPWVEMIHSPRHCKPKQPVSSLRACGFVCICLFSEKPA